MSDRDERDRKIDAWLDGEIDEADRDALNAWLLEAPENAARFAERSHLHSRLFDWARARVAPCEGDSAPIIPRPRYEWGPLAAAAVIAFALGVAFLMKQGEAIPLGEPVAQLIESPGASLEFKGRGESGDEFTLLTGDYHLSHGLARIAFESGVELVVESPARFRIDSPERVFLHSGRMAAQVPPEGVGFTIDTPGAEVVDFGTEFAIEVSEDRASEIHVFKGEVEVLPKTESNEAADPVRLVTNGATRVEFDSGVPLGIPLDDDRFLRSLDEPALQYSQVVRDSSPALYFRMGVADDGVTIRDAARGHDSTGQIVERGSKRPPFASGRIGAAVRFAGSRDGAFVLVEDYPKAGKNGLSATCWLLARSRPRLATIAENGSPENAGQFQWGLHRDSGQLQVRLPQRDGVNAVAREDAPLPVNEWQHVAFIADGETLRLYRNGEEIAATPCGPVSETEFAALVIGARWKSDAPAADQFWHGRIDEFALFNHALTPEEITAQYRAQEVQSK